MHVDVSGDVVQPFQRLSTITNIEPVCMNHRNERITDAVGRLRMSDRWCPVVLKAARGGSVSYRRRIDGRLEGDHKFKTGQTFVMMAKRSLLFPVRQPSKGLAASAQRCQKCTASIKYSIIK